MGELSEVAVAVGVSVPNGTKMMPNQRTMLCLEIGHVINSRNRLPSKKWTHAKAGGAARPLPVFAGSEENIRKSISRITENV